MKVSRLIVPAAVAVLSVGGFAAPSQAAPRDGLHCADYKSPDKVELSGDDSTVSVPEGTEAVCLKAGQLVETVVVSEDGTITSSNGKGISYYIPVPCPEYEDCGGGGSDTGS